MDQKEFWLQCFAGALHYAPPGQARAIAYEAVAVARTEGMLDAMPAPDDAFEEKVRVAAKLPELAKPVPPPKDVAKPLQPEQPAEDLQQAPSDGQSLTPSE